MSAIPHPNSFGLQLLPLAVQSLDRRLERYALALAQRFLGRLWRVLISEQDERLWAMFRQMYEVYLADLCESRSEKDFQNRLEALVRNRDAESLQRQINLLSHQGARAAVGWSWVSVLGRHVGTKNTKIRQLAELMPLNDEALQSNISDFDERACLEALMSRGVSSLVDDVCVPPELAQTLEDARGGVCCLLALVFAPNPIAPNIASLMLDHAIQGCRANLSIFANPANVDLPEHLKIQNIDIKEAFDAYVQMHDLLDQSARDAFASDQSMVPVFSDQADPKTPSEV